MQRDTLNHQVSTHSRPKAAGNLIWYGDFVTIVSTHSRPKAAGWFQIRTRNNRRCFNTQPPEGGWAKPPKIIFMASGFNTQPPEGGWLTIFII